MTLTLHLRPRYLAAAALLALVALTGSAQGASGPPPAPPAPLYRTPKVVLTAAAGQLVVERPDGSGKFQLTSPASGDGDYFPNVSTDGQLVTFERDHSSTTADIVVINSDGTHSVTVAGGNSRTPAFDRAVRNVVFTNVVSASEQAITIVDLGSHIVSTRTSSFVDSDPEFAPDGTALFFTRKLSATPHIFRMSLNGGSPVQVTFGTGEQQPTVSPDSTKLAYATPGGAIVVAQIDGSHPAIVNNPNSFSDVGSSPEWSPDGTQLCFFHAEQGGESVKIVAAVAGSNSALLDGGFYGTWGLLPPTPEELAAAVGSVAPAVNAHIDEKLAATDAKIDAVSSKSGNHTTAICPEGSVRRDPAGTLQEYLTLFSETDQPVTINFITNKGLFQKTQPLIGNTRFTVDVNAILQQAGTPFDGPDVDVSIKVAGASPVFLACPLYFDRDIGLAGHVNGGSVQDGSSN